MFLLLNLNERLTLNVCGTCRVKDAVDNQIRVDILIKALSAKTKQYCAQILLSCSLSISIISLGFNMTSPLAQPS